MVWQRTGATVAVAGQQVLGLGLRGVSTGLIRAVANRYRFGREANRFQFRRA